MLCADSLEKVHNDTELQNWGAELCRSKEDGGAGLKVSSFIIFVSFILFIYLITT